MTDLRQFDEACASIAQRPFRTLDKSRPIWVFGAGGFGRDAASVLRGKGYDVAGFIETSPRNAKSSGLPVVSWQQLTPANLTAQLVIGIFNRDTPLDGLHQLAASAGFQDIFFPYDYFVEIADGMGWRFWLDDQNIILNARERIEAVYHRLGDEQSRQCLLDMLLFRLGRKLDHAGFMHQEAQYFCDLTLASLSGRKINYVDAGAYDGDTYLKISGLADVANAFLFEPDPGNYQKLIGNVRGKEGVICLPCGLSDHHEVLSFNAGVGESGKISADGSAHVLVLPLDDLLPNIKIDMIKLDIEGSEAVALKGAARIIRESRPVLAFSLYHKASDVWELPELVDALHPDCALYIRQHHYNTFETVLYAVPGATGPR